MSDTAPGTRVTLGELAERYGLELRGDPGHAVSGVATLSSAGPAEIAFMANPAYRKQLPATRAGAVVVNEQDAEACPVNCLVAADPYLAYARVAAMFDHRPAMEPGIHPTAVVDATASLGPDVRVGAHAVVGARSAIGAGASIGPGCVIGPDSALGESCSLAANVTLMDGVRLGKRVIVHAGAVIGADGFGIASDGQHWEKVPQLGTVVIGDDCEIGANAAIDRGAIEDTVLEEDVRIDNLVQVGHNVRIGAHTAIAALTGIAGSARIGRHCLIGGGCGIIGHLEIADRVTVTARTCVMKSITEPGSVWGSEVPARPLREWQRALAQLFRLDRLDRRVRRLESQHGKEQEHE